MTKTFFIFTKRTLQMKDINSSTNNKLKDVNNMCCLKMEFNYFKNYNYAKFVPSYKFK